MKQETGEIVNNLREFLLLTSLLVAGFAHANVSIKMEIATHFEPQSGSKNVPADTNTSLDVVLAGKLLRVQSATETTFFDLEKRRRVVVDNSAKTQVNYSLYDIVGFRLAELRNRDMLGKALAAAKIDQAVMSTTDSEHILSIQEKASSPLQAKTDNADEVFWDGPKEMFRRSLQSTPVSADDARMFAKVFRYMVGGHPQILEALAKSNAIPSQLRMTSYAVFGLTTHSITVKSVVASENAPLDLPALAPRKASPLSDPIDQVLDRVAAFEAAELNVARQRNLDERADALKEGRMLEAFLASIEWALMTGDALPAFTNEQRAQLQSDVATKKVNTALAARSKEDFTEAIKIFEEARGAAGKKAYILKIFEANNRATLGDPVAAQKLFVEVLAANPYIAGVYKDLGDLLFRSFDTPRAWRSWDIGRRIAPKFANFGPLNQYENSLAANYPDFF
jgi:hypothetical protein